MLGVLDFRIILHEQIFSIVLGCWPVSVIYVYITLIVL